MASDIKAVLITGGGLRHRYAARQVECGFQLKGVVFESSPPVVQEPEKLSTPDSDVIDKHLGERNSVEVALLGDDATPVACDTLEISTGTANSEAVFSWVRDHNPDVLLLYGSSIVRPPLLDAYADRTVNMHLGLSPYYRGAATNFWPLVDGLPECLGVTIHSATLKVDGGPILTQVRPDVAATDRNHEMGTKAIIAGLAALVEAVPLYMSGKLIPTPQDTKGGKVFRHRDFNANAVRTMWRNFDDGMIRDYLANIDTRQQRYPLVTHR